jgi:protein ImuA
MNPLSQNSQHYAADRVEAFRHPGVFRFGEAPLANNAPVASGFAALDRVLNGGWPTARLIEVLCDRVGVGELSLLLSTMPKVTASSALPSGAAINTTSHVPRGRVSPSKSSTNTENSAQRSLWIVPRASQTAHAPCVAYAPALEACGIDLRRFAIAQTSSNQETLWAMEQALLSNAVKSVFAWIASHSKFVSQSFKHSQPHDFTLRRIALAARKSESLCFLMRPLSAARRASPCELRITIAPASRNEIEVTILKHRGLLHETSLRIDPRELACLAPHRVPIVLPNVVTTARNPAVESSGIASVLKATKNVGFDAPPKIRERSLLGER